MQVSAHYLHSLQNRMNLISNNLANTATTGFKQQLLSLEESYDAQDRSNTAALYGGFPETTLPVIRLNPYDGKRYDFSQGALENTGNPLDLAVSGEGFFQVKTSDGRIGYTRAGLFMVDGAGNLVNNEGMTLETNVVVPEDVSEVSIGSDGTIYGLKTATETAEAGTAGAETEEGQNANNFIELGKISLYRFANADGLEQTGGTMFYATDASGKAIEGTSGEEGFGTIQNGMVEKSNTNIMTAMADLIQAQRAYQIDIRIKQNQDEMMVTTIGMRG
ncbi:flagellar hook-basal body complex protein [Dehalobacter sp. DCM]|uniref:flagellar hook-basal body protein n=1 Tax=Dehalobacter sp. DCM TaxID=2907827 RepID=UPI0030819390|nr:flagellar hook-basal body complex protein [Dehalobacter sp. DCM]